MTMNFAEAAKMNAVFTRTENGAVALNTTGDARLDLFGTVGSLRGAEKERVTRLFSEAWKADPLFATKIAFYARGLGSRGGWFETSHSGLQKDRHPGKIHILPGPGSTPGSATRRKARSPVRLIT